MKIELQHFDLPIVKHYCQAFWSKEKFELRNTMTAVEYDRLSFDEKSEVVHCENLAVMVTKDGGHLCGSCGRLFEELENRIDVTKAMVNKPRENGNNV